MPQRYVLGAVVLVVVITILSGFVLWQSHVQMRSSMTKSLFVAAGYNEQNLTRTFESVDSTLERVYSIYERADNQGDRYMALLDGLRFAPHLRQLLITDETGEILVDSAQRPTHSTKASRINLASAGLLDHKFHSLESRLIVGKAVAGRYLGLAEGDPSATSHHWTLPVALRIESKGETRYVIAAINPSVFSAGMGSAVYGDEGEALLVRLDGVVLFGSTGKQSQRFSATATPAPRIPAALVERFRGLDAEWYRGRTPLGGGDGLIAHHLSEVYPIAAVIAATNSDIWRLWFFDNQMFVLVVAGMPFAIVLALVAFGFQLSRRLQLDDNFRIISRVVEQSPVAVMITDYEGIIRYVNRGFSELFGYEPEEVLGKTPRVLKSNLVTPQTYENLWRTIKAGGVWQGEFINQCKNGDLRWVRSVVSGLSIREDEPEFFVAVENDFTEQKRYEESLSVAKEEAEKSSKAKSNFLSMVSHELRTPLTSIIGSLGLLEYLEKGHLGENEEQLLGVAAQNSRRLNDLVNDLLDLEKIQSGQMEIRQDTVNVSELVHEAIKANTGYAHKLGVYLELVGDQPEAFIAGDQDRLLQVMANLLSNACKFSPQEGYVSVSWTIMQGQEATPSVRISVSDQGPGIPENFHGKIFTPFEQADTSSTRSVGGTGLGLSISKIIVERHNGEIVFETKEGAGTTFHISFPLVSNC